MNNPVVLIIGASRGMGAVTAKLLAQHGAEVGVNYSYNADANQQVIEPIKSDGGQALAVQADVRDPQQVETNAIAWIPPEQKQTTGQGVPLQRIGQPEDGTGAILGI